MQDSHALVLFSGGQDSTTCLAWALNRFERVETIGFDYGQRHRVELDCRSHIMRRMAELKSNWRDRLRNDHIVDLTVLGDISQTALTQDVAITMTDNGLPTTFVPGRNIIFVTFAAAVAYRRGLKHIVGGMCETDFSGYPDCRDDAIKALQVALNVGMQSRFVVHTPLMWIDKAATWRLAADLGGESFVNIIIENTHTCYLGDREQLHRWGYGCGTCPACQLRAGGYSRYCSGEIEAPKEKQYV